MTKSMVKSKLRSALRNRRAKGNERGAGGLLPIITVGMMIVIVAASIATSTSFAAKISRGQVNQMSQNIEANSLLNSFLDNIRKNTYPSPTGSIPRTGSYKVYYSTAASRPATSKDSGVVALTTSGVPTTARWLIVDLTTQTAGTQTAVYEYFRKGAAVLDSAVNWTGPVKIADSAVRAAPGTQGPISTVFKESSSSVTTQTVTLSGSTVAADAYATYTNSRTSISAGTIRGNFYSKSGVDLVSTPKVIGSVLSRSTISGTGEIAGSKTSSATSLPTAPGPTVTRYSVSGSYPVTLVAADCSTPAALKAKLESIPDSRNSSTGTRNIYKVNADACSAYPNSWATEIKPQAKLIVSSTKALPINGLKVSGSKGTLGFHSAVSLTLTNANYSNGAAGQFLTDGSLTVTDSTLVGAIVNSGTSGSALNLTRSSVLYTPVDAPSSCGQSSCGTWISTNLHLVRAS